MFWGWKRPIAVDAGVCCQISPSELRHLFPTAWSAASWSLIAESNLGLDSSPGNHLAPGITLSLGAASTQWVYAGPLDWNWDTWEGPTLIQSTNGIRKPLQQLLQIDLCMLYWRAILNKPPVRKSLSQVCLWGTWSAKRGLSEWKWLIECPRLFTKENCPAIYMGYWLDGLLFCEDTSWA